MDRGRPVLRPVGVPDHRDPARHRRTAGLLLELLPPAFRPDLPAVLPRPCGDVLRTAVVLSDDRAGSRTAGRSQDAGDRSGLVLDVSPELAVRVPAVVARAAVPEALLVAGDRRAVLPRLAVRRGTDAAAVDGN